MSFSFDIETTPDMDAINAVWERAEFVDPPMPDYSKKYKKQETIDNYERKWKDGLIARQRAHDEAENERLQKEIDRSTLRAEFSRLLCIAYHFPHGDPLQARNDRVSGESIVEWGPEGHLLRTLWDRCYATQLANGLIYTASGTQFDVRYCWRRSLILGVVLPDCLRVVSFKGARPFIHESFIDVSEVWGAGEYGYKIKVDHLAAAFDVSRKITDEGIEGGSFWKFAEENRPLAEEYAKRDAEIAWQIGDRIHRCGVAVVREQAIAQGAGE